MDSKPCVIAMFVLIFVVSQCIANGIGRMDSEIYEIDYRGPETHSFLPPPHGTSGGERLKIDHHRKNLVRHRKYSKDFRNGRLNYRDKRTRG